MAALKLPNFASDVEGYVPDPSLLPGYGAGFDAGRAQASAESAGLEAETALSIKELEFGYAEAHRALTAELQPLLSAIVAQTLPRLVDATFADHVVSHLDETARAHLNDAPIIAVHPSQVEPLKNAARSALANIEVTADATLAPHAVRVSVEGALTTVDLTRQLARIDDLCRDYFTLATERTAHG